MKVCTLVSIEHILAMQIVFLRKQMYCYHVLYDSHWQPLTNLFHSNFVIYLQLFQPGKFSATPIFLCSLSDIENVLKHQIFYTTFSPQKIFPALNFLYYFPDLENFLKRQFFILFFQFRKFSPTPNFVYLYSNLKFFSS